MVDQGGFHRSQRRWRVGAVAAPIAIVCLNEPGAGPSKCERICEAVNRSSPKLNEGRGRSPGDTANLAGK